jgi:hypothetical protein
MPNEPSDDEHFEAAQPSMQARTVKPHPPLERSRFGGTERRHERPIDDAPVSRSDLSKGTQELIEDRSGSHQLARSPHLVGGDPRFLDLCHRRSQSHPHDDEHRCRRLDRDEPRLVLRAHDDARDRFRALGRASPRKATCGSVLTTRGRSTNSFDLGRDAVRRGRRNRHALLLGHRPCRAISRPAVGGGRHHSGHPGRRRLDDVPLRHRRLVDVRATRNGDGVLRLSLGHAAVDPRRPLPLLGKRVRGPLGDGISIIALVGTVFGVATSMGIGVVLLNVGFSLLFGLEQGLALQIALVIVAVVLTIAATTSGVDRGIRWISELNLWSAAAMMVYILVTGQTAFLLNSLVENIGRFLVTLPERTLQTFAYEPDGAEWMGGWTLFFWAFWLAWGPFVGVFLARISRGRTLREFVIAAITAPVLCDFIIVSLFGNSALYEVLQGNTEFAELAVESPEQGWYALLGMFPGAMFLIGLATLSGSTVLPHERELGCNGDVKFLSLDPGSIARRAEAAAYFLGCAQRSCSRWRCYSPVA